jgi:hypothetical protein
MTNILAKGERMEKDFPSKWTSKADLLICNETDFKPKLEETKRVSSY